jgi:YbbR domain-containing protein
MLLAFGLAITVWVSATLEQNPFIENEYETAIPIEIIGLSPDLIITNDPVDTSRVRLNAQQNEWTNINPGDIRVVADLTGLGPGTHQVALNAQLQRDLPVIVVGPNPDSLRVVIEERGEREFPVRLEIEGQPAITHAIKSRRVDPTNATVRGPRSRVDLVSEVRATVPVEGRRDSLRSQITLVALDSDGNVVDGVTITPEIVNVDVRIEQIAGYKYISIRPVTLGRVAPGYYITRVEVTPRQIVVQGDPAILDNMSSSIDAFIDVTDLTADTIIQVTLTLPAGVTIVDERPIEAEVYIAAQQGSRALAVPLTVINLGEGLVAELIPDEVDILLSGPLPILDALDIETDILAILDLEGLLPGTYQVEPRIELRVGELVIESTFPTTIEVTITRDTSPQN